MDTLLTDNRKKVLWVITDLSEGSGGQRTLLQNMMYLVGAGYACDILLENTKSDKDEIKRRLLLWYGIKFNGEIFCNEDIKLSYDMAVATYYTTAKRVKTINAKHKLYFVQDYEPWFFPMSGPRIEAKESYKLGLDIVTIGRWLATDISEKFNVGVDYFDFCADLSVYKKEKVEKKEKAVCYVYQPGKPWRCSEMGLKALQIVKQIDPSIKIYLFGSEKAIPYNLEAEHLGLLSVQECNHLYNKCSVGLCLSASNPSRIPFEMMAAGLPVVDLFLDNTIYDFPEDGCLLAEPTPESLASAILEIIDNKDLAKKLSVGGSKYMKDYPIEKGFRQFVSIVNKNINDKKGTKEKPKERIYKKSAFVTPNRESFLFPAVYFRTEREIKDEEERVRREKKEAEREKRIKELPRHKKLYRKVLYRLLRRIER